MSGSWWLDRENIAAVAAHMADHGHAASEVAHMVEKPWEYNDEWECVTKAADDDADSVPGWNGAGAEVEAARG